MSETAATSDVRTGESADIPVTEIVPRRIYRLGGIIELDGRVSWAPHKPGLYTPHSNYVVIEAKRAYVINTGVAAHRELILRQINDTIPPDLPITAFLTNSEFTSVGNLGAICAERGIEELVSSSRNPFAGSEEIAGEVTGAVRRTETERGAVSPLGASRELIVIPPLIRLLNTFWVYDKVSKTLFTADLFGHVPVASPPDRPVVDRLDEDQTTYEDVREHTLCRYHWLPIATTDTLVAWLKKIFDTFEVEIIAPTSGCVLKGRPVVEKHYGLMVDLLERVPNELD